MTMVTTWRVKFLVRNWFYTYGRGRYHFITAVSQYGMDAIMEGKWRENN